MLLSRTDRIERYTNGNIRYMETIGVIAPMWIAQYPNHRASPDGSFQWVRVGVNRKYHENGKLEWEILYDDHGNAVK